MKYLVVAVVLFLGACDDGGSAPDPTGAGGDPFLAGQGGYGGFRATPDGGMSPPATMCHAWPDCDPATASDRRFYSSPTCPDRLCSLCTFGGAPVSGCVYHAPEATAGVLIYCGADKTDCN